MPRSWSFLCQHGAVWVWVFGGLVPTTDGEATGVWPVENANVSQCSQCEMTQGVLSGFYF